MIVRRFQPEDIDAVFEIKQAAYKPLSKCGVKPLTLAMGYKPQSLCFVTA